MQQISYFWSDKGPAGDCFWWLDVLLLLGGIHSESTATWAHERKIRIICRCLFAYHAVAFVLQLNDALYEEKKAALVVWELMKVIFIFVAYLKVVLVVQLKGSIATLRQFIRSNHICSGDIEYDELEQNKFNKIVRITIQVVFVLIIIDTLILSVPNFSNNDLLKLPHLLALTGMFPSYILKILLTSCLGISVIPKYFACTACVGAVLIGMRTRLRILAHRFEHISQQDFTSEEKAFECVNRDIQEALAQHLEYWSHLKAMKIMVSKTFLKVHYFSIVAIGSLIYVCCAMGVNGVTFVIGAGTVSFLMEYYLLCHLVDLLQDEADSIGYHIFRICAQIPYNSELRSEYVQLRTTLMIVWINTRNGISLNCLGLFEITTFTFVTLIDAAYSVLMFLIKMGKIVDTDG
ncbi:AAEL017009-PA [Aedes aegypti]|nr:AAEL017009-PA [Aedes aegypti]DAA80445.1 TPA_exp: odorant receptor 119 [Aedes aegypti]